MFFTGSSATGARIAAAVGPRMVRLQLELGGKDPTYVGDDVDVKAAAESLADGAMYNTGQSCCSVERIYVHETHPRRLRRPPSSTRCRASRSAIRRDEDTYIGADHARAAARRARGAGRRRARQGRDACAPAASASRGQGNWFEPTVFTDVDHRMALMREESFGPIIGIQKVADDDEALALMNDTHYGLTAGVYTPRRSARAANAARAGQRRQRLLELLRPREPAPAVVGARRLGRRR